MRLKHFPIFGAIFLLMNSCDYRTPSNVRFQKITGINLPDSINVIQDRFEGAGTDYVLYYDIKLKQTDCNEIYDRIKSSQGWIKSENDWQFHKTVDGTIYTIYFSVDKCTISYSEELI